MGSAKRKRNRMLRSTTSTESRAHTAGKPYRPARRYDYVYYGKRIIYHTRLRNTTALIVRRNRLRKQ